MIIEEYDIRCDYCGRHAGCDAGSPGKARKIAVAEHLWQHTDKGGDKCYECLRGARMETPKGEEA